MLGSPCCGLYSTSNKNVCFVVYIFLSVRLWFLVANRERKCVRTLRIDLSHSCWILEELVTRAHLALEIMLFNSGWLMILWALSTMITIGLVSYMHSWCFRADFPHGEGIEKGTSHGNWCANEEDERGRLRRIAVYRHTREQSCIQFPKMRAQVYLWYSSLTQVSRLSALVSFAHLKFEKRSAVTYPATTIRFWFQLRFPARNERRIWRIRTVSTASIMQRVNDGKRSNSCLSACSNQDYEHWWTLTIVKLIILFIRCPVCPILSEMSTSGLY